MSDPSSLPILANKDYLSPSVFTPENLLREARRQKSIHEGSVPKVHLLKTIHGVSTIKAPMGEKQEIIHY